MKHFEKCVQDKIQWEKDVKDFADQYPGFCRTCMAWGGHFNELDTGHTPESHDEAFAGFTFCPDCLDQGKCPRCSSPNCGIKNHNDICNSCGFEWGEGSQDDVMYWPYCHCQKHNEAIELATLLHENGLTSNANNVLRLACVTWLEF